MSLEHMMLLDQARLRREGLMRRVLHMLRSTIEVVPTDPDVDMDLLRIRVEMTDKSAQVIAPLLEAVEILEAIIWASDDCMGHKNCVHSMEPWQRARKLLAGKWEADIHPDIDWPPAR